jgi:hypothetical protein
MQANMLFPIDQLAMLGLLLSLCAMFSSCYQLSALGLLLGLISGLHTCCHSARSPGDGVRHVEVSQLLDGGRQGLAAQLPLRKL